MVLGAYFIGGRDMDLKESRSGKEREFGKLADEEFEELMGDFLEHFEECKKRGMTDRAQVFQLWMLQKVANLFVIVQQEAQAVRRLIARRCTRGK